jgi:hypothetical protein
VRCHGLEATRITGLEGGIKFDADVGPMELVLPMVIEVEAGVALKHKRKKHGLVLKKYYRSPPLPTSQSNTRVTKYPGPAGAGRPCRPGRKWEADCTT